VKLGLKQESRPFYIIFSDLDGTLLDGDTYEYQEAQEALFCLKEHGIPLILNSSKTRAEIEFLRRDLKNGDPFIVENGAALFIPGGLFGPIESDFEEKEGYQIIELGISYPVILAFFQAIKTETGLRAMGFSEMSAGQIARSTGLTKDKAALAKRRDYSEPFLVMEQISESQWEDVEQAVRKRNLKLLKSDRFYHLIGPHDKGKLVRLIKKLYLRKYRSVVTIGLGDGPDDLPMLENVDIPALIKKKNGGFEEWPGPSPVYYPRGIGPKGWNTFILDRLKEIFHE
jgi:mannosyl-3-phosphoglycerate phosphatase